MGVQNSFLILFFVCTIFSCSEDREQPEQDQVTVLKGATLIDGSGAPARQNSVIVIQGERIVRVGQESGTLPDDADVRDLTGRYILPGFIDTHVHFVAESEVHSQTLRTLLAFGVTTVRNPGTIPKTGTKLRDKLAAGEILGPRMLTAGQFIYRQFPRRGGEVRNEAKIREEVRRQVNSGVDFIKLQEDLTPDLVKAVIDEAHKHGVKVIGHLLKTSWGEAARAGIDVLCHSDWSGPMREFIPKGSCTLFESQAVQFQCWRENARLDGAEMDTLVSFLLENHIEVNPTLVRTEVIWWGDDLSMLEKMEPHHALVSNLANKWWRDDWREQNPYSKHLSRETLSELKQLFPTVLEVVRIFHERGVLITAGTDTGNPWLTPGVSFHHELELLVKAGIPANEVLQIATQNGAKALGILDQTGTIAAGKFADLVILSANPLDDIRNTRKIEAVIKAGEWLVPESLFKTNDSKK